MIKYISERMYEIFRIDGIKNNSQIDETMTVAVQLEDGTNPISSTNPLPVTEQPPSSIAHALATVTTAGTQIQLASNDAKSITIKASVANTGIIYVGGSAVSSSDGFPLSAGDTLSLDISNTNVIWIDSSVNGETASWISNA